MQTFEFPTYSLNCLSYIVKSFPTTTDSCIYHFLNLKLFTFHCNLIGKFPTYGCTLEFRSTEMILTIPKIFGLQTKLVWRPNVSTKFHNSIQQTKSPRNCQMFRMLWVYYTIIRVISFYFVHFFYPSATSKRFFTLRCSHRCLSVFHVFQ